MQLPAGSTEPVTPGWARLYFSAQVDLLRHFATSPGAEVGTAAVEWVVSGVASNTHNGVVRAALGAKTADAAIERTIARFRERGVPATWFVDDDSTPADLGPRLEAAGARAERAAWVMGADLDELPDAGRAVPADLCVVEVTRGDQLDAWLDAATGVAFDADDGDDDNDQRGSRAARRRLYASVGLGRDRRWRHWLALDGGVPVGTASGFFSDHAVAIENVGVVPSHRRRGVGTALTLAPVIAARALRVPAAVLGPSPQGRWLYEALGFTLTPARSEAEYYLPVP